MAGNAATALSRSGHFDIPLPRDNENFITPAFARELAHVFFQTFAFPNVSIGPSFGELIANVHGPFSPWRVRVAQPIYFAESPYAPLADSIPSYVRKYLGPRYMLYYRHYTRIIAGLGVSALNTDLWIEKGHIRGPPVQGGEFRTAVPPRRGTYAHPIAAERAVEVVGVLTGAKTIEVPRLVLPHRHYFSGFARWELVLDRELSVVGDSTGRPYVTRVVYVGSAGPSQISGLPGSLEQIWVAFHDQPVEDTVPYRAVGSDDIREVRVHIIDPVHFERAVLLSN